ncbi:hypothetical protein [Paenibacillus oceani]|uniref:hypothetical protein n=1 Tax=Paenibacillus oceani TaxID=2772510 RepID=UPI001CC2379C|nr:hypothetical protein [Paenibacillus oceani]
MIPQIRMEEVAVRELAGLCEFQTFDEQVAELGDTSDETLMERMKFKAGMDLFHGS